ncbi:MAG: hypothetical protein HXX80_01740 [Nitrososphaerales archaeon]|nr:hypothetical protein [Nitrososphaerales archaeon]
MNRWKMIGIISIIIGALLIAQKMVFYGAVYTPRYFFDIFDHGLYGIVFLVVGLILSIGIRRGPSR